MKSLLKTTLLATSLAFAFSAPQAFAEEAAKVPTLNSAFKTQNEQNAYALGASMGRAIWKLHYKSKKILVLL